MSAARTCEVMARNTPATYGGSTNPLSVLLPCSVHECAVAAQPHPVARCHGGPASGLVALGRGRRAWLPTRTHPVVGFPSMEEGFRFWAAKRKYKQKERWRFSVAGSRSCWKYLIFVCLGAHLLWGCIHIPALVEEGTQAFHLCPQRVFDPRRPETMLCNKEI